MLSLPDFSRFEALRRHPRMRWLVMSGRVLRLLRAEFKEKRIASMAQALAYSSMLAMVPVFAIFFSVLGKVTADKQVQESIKDFISVYFFPEYVTNIFAKVENLASNSLALGAIGLPALFASGIFLYVKVASSINSIWSTKQERVWFRNSLAFLMTLVFGPMILVLVFSLPPYLNTLPFYQEIINYPLTGWALTNLAPVAVSAVGLLVLYLYIPAVRVELTAAVRGALVAAVLIQVANVGMSWYLKLLPNFDLLYGSLAFIPIFLLWVFLLWLLVLTGSAVGYVYQQYHKTAYLEVAEVKHEESLFSTALRVVLYLVAAFERKKAAPDFEQIQLMLGVERRRLNQILNRLVKHGLITRFEDLDAKGKSPLKYQPGVDPALILVQDLLPLFHRTREEVVFSEELNQLLVRLDQHPALFVLPGSVKDLLAAPGLYLEMLNRYQPASNPPN